MKWWDYSPLEISEHSNIKGKMCLLILIENTKKCQLSYIYMQISPYYSFNKIELIVFI